MSHFLRDAVEEVRILLHLVGGRMRRESKNQLFPGWGEGREDGGLLLEEEGGEGYLVVWR